MTPIELFNLRSSLNAEMSQLMSNLSANTSPIGDWKVLKCYEARMSGNPDPYDFAALTAERQAARDRISAIREELALLPPDDPSLHI